MCQGRPAMKPRAPKDLPFTDRASVLELLSDILRPVLYREFRKAAPKIQDGEPN